MTLKMKMRKILMKSPLIRIGVKRILSIDVLSQMIILSMLDYRLPDHYSTTEYSPGSKLSKAKKSSVPVTPKVSPKGHSLY